MMSLCILKYVQVFKVPEMKKIDIQKTKFTPSVLLDIANGLIEIKGDSLPENTTEFYAPLLCEVQEYLKNPKEKTIVNLELTYFNSSSSKLFFDFFDIFDEFENSKSIEINWIFDSENENIEEAGEDFKDDFEDLNFNLIIK